MAKHIGIVACSAEGAALCYRTICKEGAQRMGKHAHPEITMHNHCLSDYMVHICTGDWDGVAKLMLSSAEKLAGAGADLLISPDNTIHEAFDIVAKKSPLPWLHIADEVTKEAKQAQMKRLGLLGTKYLMSGPVYPKSLGKYGIDHVLPSPDETEEINRIIFDELVNGVFIKRSREYLLLIIGNMRTNGCQGVVLGCTEIPLIINDKISPLPTLDSTRLLARAALREAYK